MTLKPACDNSRASTPPAAPDPTTTKSTVSPGLKMRLGKGAPKKERDSARGANRASRPKCAKLFFVSPTELYSTRLADRKQRLAHFDALNARIESIRLGIGASFLIIAWLCFGPLRLTALWLTIPVVGFIALLAYHQRVRNRRTQAQRAVDFYQAALDRINDE
jgi:hypothetical protein